LINKRTLIYAWECGPFRNEGSGTVVLYRNFVSYRLRKCAVMNGAE